MVKNGETETKTHKAEGLWLRNPWRIFCYNLHEQKSAFVWNGECRERHTGRSLQDIMRWFKTMVTNEYIAKVKDGQCKPFEKKLWQKSYHDHIIRGEADYKKIWEYIDTNEIKWEEDCFYTNTKEQWISLLFNFILVLIFPNHRGRRGYRRKHYRRFWHAF